MTHGPFGIAFFAAVENRTDANPHGYVPAFLENPDAYGKQIIARALACGGKVIQLYDIEGQADDYTRYVGYPLAAPRWVREWLRRFARDCKAARLRIMFLIRQYWPTQGVNDEGIQIPMGLADMADGMLKKMQNTRFFLESELDVCAGFHWDDNYLPENKGSGTEDEAIPASIVADIQRRLPGGPLLLTTEIYGKGYEDIPGVIPCRWGDAAPSRPFKELVMPSGKTELPLAPLTLKRIKDFKSGDECAFSAHYDAGNTALNMAAWRASQGNTIK